MGADALTAHSIAAGLGTRCLGRRVLVYSSLPSTMDRARQAAREGAPEGTIVIAEEQTAGRGRQGRAWLAPPGNIALSLLLRPTLEQLPSLNMVASLAVVRAVARTTGIQACIKWPNDVMVGSRKLCGILVDSELAGDTVNFAVVGLGLNVNLNPGDYPEIAATATSLSRELGGVVPRLPVVQALLEEMEALYLRLRQGESLLAEWRYHLATLGQRVVIIQGQQRQEGFAEEVAADGSLLLRLPDGSLLPVVAGEVSLRPAP